MNDVLRGQTAHCAGLAAEDSVVRVYADLGCTVVAQRWRGRGGEIDLILDDGQRVIFVEVKKADDFATAASRIGPVQQARLLQAAEEYLGTRANGALTDCRFDAALVDVMGRVEVIENAFL